MTLYLELFAERERECDVLLRLAVERLRYPAGDVGRIVEVGEERGRVTTFRRQLVADEARPGTPRDVVRQAVSTGRVTAGARRLHGPLEGGVDEVREAAARHVAVVARILRIITPTPVCTPRFIIRQRVVCARAQNYTIVLGKVKKVDGV